MEIILIALLTIVAAFIGTLTGFGSSTIMLPVIVLFFPLPQALLFVGIIHWFNDIWKIILFKKGVNWKILLGFGIPGVIASFIGARLIFTASQALLSQILGGFLIAYTIFLFVNPAFKLAQTNLTAISGGTLSGFFAGIFGLGGAIRATFLSAFGLPKAVYIFTSGAIALIIDSTRIVTYWSGGSKLTTLLAWGLIAFIPASLVGAGIAKRIVDKIPQNKFRSVVALFLLLVGIKLLLFPG
jgi:hypothetical protein